MKKEITIPSLGESISEATIGQILSPTGTVVKMDDEILELETDKVNQVLYAPQEGRVSLSVKTGETVKIGQTIGWILSFNEEGRGAQETIHFDKKGEEPVQPSFSLPLEAPKEASIEKPQKKTEANAVREVRLEDFHPSQRDDFPVRETRRPMSKIRKVIAARLVEAQHAMAMLTTFNEVDMTRVIELREKYKESFIKHYGCKLGFLSFFVKAVVSALQEFPVINSWIDGDEIVHREYYDIGVAVGTDKGVIVPVIRNCDRLSFAEIEQLIENYAKKARDGGLIPSDLQGGGFTITNGGVYGSLLSTPILLPPQCGILGMHKIEKRPVVIDDQIVIRSMMYLALSYDHRLIDGKEAVQFLSTIKDMLEEPSRLLLKV